MEKVRKAAVRSHSRASMGLCLTPLFGLISHATSPLNFMDSFKTFLCLCAVLGLAQAAEAATSGYRLSWVTDPTSSITIGWTDDGADSGADYVMFGEKGTDEGTWTRHDITETIPYNNTRHSGGADDPEVTNAPFDSNFVFIDTLEPDHDYAFRVYNGDDVASELMWFRTAPDTPSDFCFIAGGDSRSNNDPREWGNEIIAAVRPLFVAHNGDYLDDGTNAEWREWLKEWATLTRSTDGRMYPIVPAHGNHENDLTDMMWRIFRLKDADDGFSAYNAINIGGTQLRVYTLNTEIEPGVGYGEFSGQSSEAWDAQNAWFIQDLTNNAGFDWKFASYHRPMRPHTSSKTEGLGRIAAWAQAMYDHGLDLVIESDTHMVKYTYPLKPQLDSGTAEPGTWESFVRADNDPNGIVFAGEGSWGAPRRATDDNKPWTMASDSLWQFKLINVVADDPATPGEDESALEVRTIMFDQLAQVDGITPLTQAEQDADPKAMTSGLVFWEPVTGGTLRLPFEAESMPAIHFELAKFNDQWSYFTGPDAPSNDGEGDAWNESNYDDSTWSTDFAEFGYGDGDEATEIGFGGDSENKWPVAYFRRTLDIPTGSQAIRAEAALVYDDGAVIYINGQEVYRTASMPTGDLSGVGYINANQEVKADAPERFTLNGDAFVDGINTIAVAVYQDNGGSSDTSFDMFINVLVGQTPGAAPAAPTNLNASDAASLDTITVSWEVVAGATGYLLEYKGTGDTTWKVLEGQLEDPKFPVGGNAGDNDFNEFDIDGGVATYTLPNLDDGQAWDFRVRAYSPTGASAPSNMDQGSTEASPLNDLFYEDFEDDSFDGPYGTLNVVNVLGTKPWYINTAVSSLSNFANGNSWSSGGSTNNPHESWMILPTHAGVFYGDLSLQFNNVVRYSDYGPDGVADTTDDVFGLDVLVSNDYDPNNPDHAANPNNATWVSILDRATLETNRSDWGDWVGSDLVKLDDVVSGKSTVAFLYESSGNTSNASSNWEIDAIRLSFTGPGIDFEGTVDTKINQDPNSDEFWTFYNLGSIGGADDDWHYQEVAGRVAAVNNNYDSGDVNEINPGEGKEADDWLVSDPFFVSDVNTAIVFDYYEKYSDDANPQPLAVLVTDNFTGDVETTTWTDITPQNLDGSADDSWVTQLSAPFGLTGSDVVLAFHYTSSGFGGGSTKRIGIDQIGLRVLGDVEVNFAVNQIGGLASFSSTVFGAPQPISYLWDFGDGTTSTEESPSHLYAGPGPYTVKLTITDGDGNDFVTTKAGAIEAITVVNEPVKTADLRIMTFNVESLGSSFGAHAAALQGGENEQYRAVAEVAQRFRPDILLINEFDWDPDGLGATALLDEYLNVSQNGATPIDYTYVYIAPANTGVHSGFDLNNDGQVDNTPGDMSYADDAFGFGEFEGRYSFIILSAYEIDEANIRTFQNFLWKDMPGALLPAETDGTPYYSTEELEVFRLSSKNHVDLPIIFAPGEVIHVLASHPTPPTFDDGTDLDGIPGGLLLGDKSGVDENGFRNHDEIRFWADYINGEAYFYDDHGGHGGLAPGAPFVIMGDLNADHDEGDSTANPAQKFLFDNPNINTDFVPISTQASDPSDTAGFAGGVRVDYVLPSAELLEVVGGAVFWPQSSEQRAYLGNASDHHPVYIDVNFAPQGSGEDTDKDGILDSVEQQIIDDNPDDALETLEDVLPGDDYDHDGLDNQTESDIGTSAILMDTDGDLFTDGEEVGFGSDPLEATSIAVSQELMTALELRFNTFVGLTYQVQYSEDLQVWNNVGDSVAGTGNIESIFISFEGRAKTREHYRLVISE